MTLLERCFTCGRVLFGQHEVSGWSHKFCLSHSRESRCASCNLPIDSKSRVKLCGQCGPMAISDVSVLRVALPEVRLQLRKIGLRLGTPVRVKLVSPQSIAASANDASPMLHGLTLMTPHRSLEIQVLKGLSPARFGAVVAHETMHAYLNEQQIPQTHPSTTEGMCELLAYMWLKSRVQSPLIRWETMRIETNQDPVYGHGFCAAKACVEELGLLETLSRIRFEGRLPNWESR